MSAAAASIWTADQLARYGMSSADPDELVHAGLVPNFSSDPPHVLQWRAELLRTCAGLPVGSSVHLLSRTDPSGRSITVLAYFWSGSVPRLAVSADTEERAPSIWGSWIAAPLLAVARTGDPATLDDTDPLQGPPPYLARVSMVNHRAPPFVLRRRWLDTTAGDRTSPQLRNPADRSRT